MLAGGQGRGGGVVQQLTTYVRATEDSLTKRVTTTLLLPAPAVELEALAATVTFVETRAQDCLHRKGGKRHPYIKLQCAHGTNTSGRGGGPHVQ